MCASSCPKAASRRTHCPKPAATLTLTSEATANQDRTPPRTPLRRLFRIGCLALPILALLVAEIIARRLTTLQSAELDWDAIRTFYAHAPYVEHGCKNPYDPKCAEDNPYFPDATPWPDEIDIVVLGGSTAHGAFASSYETTFFRRLSAYTGLEVVSAAKSAYVSGQELAMLSRQILLRHPQQVFLVSGLNDFYVPRGAGVPASFPHTWVISEHTGHPLVVLGRYSGLANLVAHNWLKGKAFEHKTMVPLNEITYAWNVNFTAMAALCRGSEIRLIFVLQPNGYEVEQAATGMPGNPEWAAFATFIADACAREGVPFVDGTHAVSLDHFIDPPAHFDDAGQEQFAAFLQSRLAL